MEEFITVGESIVISAFSMLIVFAGLIIILGVISLLRVISNRQDKELEKTVETNEITTVEVNETDETEIISAISAALAIVMETSTDKIIIQKITRVNNMDNWTQAGLNEQMSMKVQ